MSNNFSDSIDVHYPTTVMRRDHDDIAELNKALSKLLLDMANKYRDTDQNAVKSGRISTEGGYQTSTQLNLLTLSEPAIAQFKTDILQPAIRKYLREHLGPESEQISPWPVAWANCLQTGDWQRPHFHPTPNNLASGVYYVSIPDDNEAPGGSLEFFNPIPASVNHGFSSTRRLQPKVGSLIMFPPWYVHYVLPFKSEGTRIIIAFDVLAERPGAQLVF